MKISGGRDDDLKRSNEEGGPWKLVEPNKEKVRWTSSCPLSITCCRDAFRPESQCKFAFCAYCTVDLEERFAKEDGGAGTNRTKRARGKAVANSPAVQSTGGEKKSEKNVGGVLPTCGQYPLRDILLVDFKEASVKWMQRNNKEKKGWEYIASHCDNCGKEFY